MMEPQRSTPPAGQPPRMDGPELGAGGAGLQPIARGAYPRSYAHVRLEDDEADEPLDVFGGSDETAALLRRVEGVTRENTVRALHKGHSLAFLVLFVSLFGLAAAAAGSDRWFVDPHAAPGEPGMAAFGLYRQCDASGACVSVHDECDAMDVRSGFCVLVLGAAVMWEWALVSLFFGVVAAAWSVWLSYRRPESRPVLRLVLLTGVAAHVSVLLPDATAMMLVAAGEVSADRELDSRAAYDTAVAATVFSVVAAIYALMLWCGCGRVRCSRCTDLCFALRRPAHLAPVARAHEQQMAQQQPAAAAAAPQQQQQQQQQQQPPSQVQMQQMPPPRQVQV